MSGTKTFSKGERALMSDERLTEIEQQIKSGPPAPYVRELLAEVRELRRLLEML